jgi:hypothetical protein
MAMAEQMSHSYFSYYYRVHWPYTKTPWSYATDSLVGGAGLSLVIKFKIGNRKLQTNLPGFLLFSSHHGHGSHVTHVFDTKNTIHEFNCQLVFFFTSRNGNSVVIKYV